MCVSNIDGDIINAKILLDAIFNKVHHLLALTPKADADILPVFLVSLLNKVDIIQY
jgi:hypothetical protein